MKIINNILILIGILIIAFSLYHEDKILDEAIKYENTGDKFFENMVYDEAIENYKKYLNLVDDINIRKKIVEANIKAKKYNDAINMLNSNVFDNDFIENKEIEILQNYLNDGEYKNYNNYLKLVSEKVKNEFNKKTFALYNSTGKIYSNIKYSPKQDYFIVNRDGKWIMINEGGRAISAEKFDDIIGSEENYYTVIDGKNTKVIDNKGNIKSNLNDVNYSIYKEGYIVKKENSGQYYVNRAGEKLSKTYKLATNFSKNIALVYTDKWILIDNNFSEIEKYEFKNIKIDDYNTAIHDNKIIFEKNNKYIIYDINSKKYSDEYEEIDYSYGNLIAVKKEKWGFIDENFDNKIDFKYDFANSFTFDTAIVKKNNENYVLDEKGKEYLINDEILPFNKNGVSFRKNKNGYEMIKLMRYIND